MKSFLEILSGIHLGRFKDLEEGSNKLSDNNDKLIVWIVSLSTGAIVLFLSSKKFDFISTENLRLIILFFILSIIGGVIGRTLSAISSLIGYRLNSDFVYSLKSIEIPYTERKLEGDESAEMIYLLFKEDFDIEFPMIIDNSKNMTGDELIKYNEQMRTAYLDFAMIRKQDLGEAIESMNNIMIDSFGLKKNHFDKKRHNYNRINGLIMRTCHSAHLYFYGFSMTSFSVAIIFTMIKIYCEFN